MRRWLGVLVMLGLFVGVTGVSASAAGLDDKAHRRQLAEQVQQHREAAAAAPGKRTVRRDLGEALYYHGVASEDEDALKEAEAIFEQLHASDPDDAVSQAYLGSLLLKKVKRVWAPWKKGELSKQGILLLDAAVEQAPEDPLVRFVRAATTYHLPDGFERQEQNAADLAWLAEHAEQHVASGALPAHLAAAALVRHATLRHRVGDTPAATAAAQRAATLAPESHAAHEAHELLDELSE